MLKNVCARGAALSYVAVLAAGLLAGSQAQATTYNSTIAFDPATTKCGFFVKSGICTSARNFAAPITAVAGDVFHVTVTTKAGVPIKVPGSTVANGIYVDAYDASATLGPGAPGPIVAHSFVYPLGLVTSAGVPPYVQSTPHRSTDYLGSTGYTATYGTPNDGFSATGVDAYLQVITPDALPTIGVSAGYFWTTNDIPQALSLLGGTADAPVILSGGLVGSISSTIGDPNGPTEQYYNFNWFGGIFQTLATINGAAAGSEFTFHLRGLNNGYDQFLSLNDANNFSALFSDNLSSGHYLIGLSTGAVADPTFTFDFKTPVGHDAIPEPSTWALLLFGFGGIGALLRRRALMLAA